MEKVNDTEVSRYLKNLPKIETIRQELCVNLRQAKLLRQLLRIAEQRDRVEEAKQGSEKRAKHPTSVVGSFLLGRCDMAEVKNEL